MKGKVGSILMILAVLVVVLLTGCGGATVGYVEDMEKIEGGRVPDIFHPNGLIYFREDKEMGQVLCFGGTGEMLPKGIDSIGIDLEVPSEGAIIEFEYKVYAAAGDLAYFVVRRLDDEEWNSWMTRKQATDWETASFVASEASRLRLIFEAKRAAAGSTGCAVCIDNFRVRQASIKERTPIPLPTQ